MRVKRCFSSLISLVMLVSLLSAPAAAAEEPHYEVISDSGFSVEISDEITQNVSLDTAAAAAAIKSYSMAPYDGGLKDYSAIYAGNSYEDLVATGTQAVDNIRLSESLYGPGHISALSCSITWDGSQLYMLDIFYTWEAEQPVEVIVETPAPAPETVMTETAPLTVSVDPAGEAAPAYLVPGTEGDGGATISFQMAVEGHGDGKNYFCEPPTVAQVTDEDGLQSIDIDIKAERNMGTVYGADFHELLDSSTLGEVTTYDIASKLAGQLGDVTVTVIDKNGGMTAFKFVLWHTAKGTIDMRRVGYPANCTEDAKIVNKYYCGYCGELWWEYQTVYPKDHPSYEAAKGHDFREQTFQNTCEGTGECVLEVCQRCGFSRVKDGGGSFNPDAEQHSWEHKVQDAGCTKPGMTYDECQNCHAIKNAEVTTPSTGHYWSAYYQETAPDCSTGTPGKQTRRCEICSATESYNIPANHSYGGVGKRVKVKDATCTEPAKLGYKCQICGQVSAENTWIDDGQPLGHQFDSGFDCVNGGFCSRCEQQIEGTGSHNMVYGFDHDSHWEYCTNDGCIYTTQAQAVAHTKPDSYNCTHSYTCPVCLQTIEPLPGAAHQLEKRYDDNSHWMQCINPGCTHKEQQSSHNMTNIFDCTADEKCQDCDFVIPAEYHTHNWSDTYSSNDHGHWKTCQNPECNITTDVSVHDDVNDYDCTTEDKCPTCGYTVRPQQGTEHNFSLSPWQSAGELGHYQTCQNEGCQQISGYAPHSGGKATCVDQAICEQCKASYGVTNPKEHAGPIMTENRVAATEEREGYSGDEVCQACRVTVTSGQTIPKLQPSHQHSFTIPMEDDNACWKQCSCGERSDYRPHDFEQKSDASGHWRECKNCHHQTEHLQHVVVKDDDCTTPQICSECQYVVLAAQQHNFSHHIYGYSTTEHWFQCENENCAGTSEHIAHDHTDDGDCTTRLTCECGFIVKEAESHDWATDATATAEGHYYRCLNAGCEQRDMHDHVPSEDDGNCATVVECTVCFYEIKPAQEHNYTGSLYQSNGNGYHYQTCTNPGCNKIGNLQPCHGGTATCSTRAVCDDCFGEYGGFDETNHQGGTQLEGYKWPTTKEPGYSGNEVCLGCGKVVKPGYVLDQLPEDHVHDYETQSDSLHHWQQCSECGFIWTESASVHRYTGGGYQSDERGHWQVCADCGAAGPVNIHLGAADDHNCNTPIVCRSCGYEMLPAQEHEFDLSSYSSDGNSHWHQCIHPNCDHIGEVELHSVADDGDCTTALNCSICGHVIAAAMSHDFSNEYVGDSTGHWQVCIHDGCEVTSESENHSGGTPTCKYPSVCIICGQYYGELDPLNHQGGTELRDRVPATETTEGYTGDLHCLDCGAVLEHGEVIPALGGEHQHDFDTAWHCDTTHHWKECFCGEQDSMSAHVFETLADENGHWRVCQVCEFATSVIPHNFDDSGVCRDCDYGDPNYVPATKLEVTEGLDEVPAELADKFSTPESLEDAMLQTVVTEGFEGDDSVVYDVELLVWSDSGWILADPDNFPAEGLTVTLPYPKGTGYSGYDFFVAHMFSHGERAGTFEYPVLTETLSGLQFTVTGLSPIVVSWKSTEAHDHAYAGWHFNDNSHWHQCSVCGDITDLGDHVFVWQHDDDGHWQLCGTCQFTTDKAEHVFIDGKCECGALDPTEHEHSYDESVWEFNEVHHWHICDVCGGITERAEHAFEEGVCTICGYKDPNYVPGGDEPSEPTPTPGGDEPSEPTPTPGGDEPSEPTPTPGSGDDEPNTPVPTKEPDYGAETPTQTPGGNSGNGSSSGGGSNGGNSGGSNGGSSNGGSANVVGKTPGKVADTTPDTGDTTNITLWVGLTLLFTTALSVAYIVYRRKKTSNK